MALFGKIFWFYAVLFVAAGILLLKVRKPREPRTHQPREDVPLRTYAEIMEEKAKARGELQMEERTYVSPCLSCTKVIDPVNCPGCSIARPGPARPDPVIPERRAS